MISLSVTKPLSNFTRWEVDEWDPREKFGEGILKIILRSAGPTNYTISRQLYVRNGLSDVLGYLAVVGGAIPDQLVVTEMGLATPTGFDDAYTAYRSGAGKAGRIAALEGFLLSSGIVNATLTGT
jgi:hypothetical protein